MNPQITITLYIVVFLVVSVLTYHSLTAFDFEKILRRNKVRELYFLLYLASFIVGFLAAEAITTLLERIVTFITA